MKQKAKLKCYKKAGPVKTSKQLEDNDSWVENAAEIFDPTGITSWDDVYRSYKNTGLSSDTGLEIFGALPILGKIKKVGKFTDFIAKEVAATNRQKNNAKFLANTLKATPTIGRASDAIQFALGSKDNTGLKTDEFGMPTTYNGRNIFPNVNFKFDDAGNYSKKKTGGLMFHLKKGGNVKGYDDGNLIQNNSSDFNNYQQPGPIAEKDPYQQYFNTTPVPENLSELPSYRAYTYAKGAYAPLTPGYGKTTNPNVAWDKKTGYNYQLNPETLKPWEELPIDNQYASNLDRFVIRPYSGEQQTNDLLIKKDLNTGSIYNEAGGFNLVNPIAKPKDKQEIQNNVFQDLYAQNLYKYKGDRDTAYKVTTGIMKERVEPKFNNKYYNYKNNPNLSDEEKEIFNASMIGGDLPDTYRQYTENNIANKILHASENENLPYEEKEKLVNQETEKFKQSDEYKNKYNLYVELLKDYYKANPENINDAYKFNKKYVDQGNKTIIPKGRIDFEPETTNVGGGKGQYIHYDNAGNSNIITEDEYKRLEKLGVRKQLHLKKGGLLKRADGSYSQRGLWDNIRANKGSGNKPTKAMLKQEKKIKAQEKADGGEIQNLFDTQGPNVESGNRKWLEGMRYNYRIKDDKKRDEQIKNMYWSMLDESNGDYEHAKKQMKEVNSSYGSGRLDKVEDLYYGFDRADFDDNKLNRFTYEYFNTEPLMTNQTFIPKLKKGGTVDNGFTNTTPAVGRWANGSYITPTRQDSLDLYNFTQLQKKLEQDSDRRKKSFIEKNFGNSPSLTPQGIKDQAILKAEAIRILKNNPNLKSGLYNSPIKPSVEDYTDSYDIYHPKIKPKGLWWGIALNNDYTNVKPIEQSIPQQNKTVYKLTPQLKKVIKVQPKPARSETYDKAFNSANSKPIVNIDPYAEQDSTTEGQAEGMNIKGEKAKLKARSYIPSFAGGGGIEYADSKFWEDRPIQKRLKAPGYKTGNMVHSTPQTMPITNKVAQGLIEHYPDRYGKYTPQQFISMMDSIGQVESKNRNIRQITNKGLGPANGYFQIEQETAPTAFNRYRNYQGFMKDKVSLPNIKYKSNDVRNLSRDQQSALALANMAASYKDKLNKGTDIGPLNPLHTMETWQAYHWKGDESQIPERIKNWNETFPQAKRIKPLPQTLPRSPFFPSGLENGGKIKFKPSLQYKKK